MTVTVKPVQSHMTTSSWKHTSTDTTRWLASILNTISHQSPLHITDTATSTIPQTYNMTDGRTDWLSYLQAVPQYLYSLDGAAYHSWFSGLTMMILAHNLVALFTITANLL